mmetsp:Transcript_3144/g.9595  ORF Transcript_3144/g.9595 Transcript_3144/m.9595 type:complete len:220 (-) Transcript_3144:236-895(-)
MATGPVVEERDLTKYRWQRYRLFSRFDHGVLLDEDMWFSITHEKIAVHHAERLGSRVVVDAFAGAGGNCIQLAKTCPHVIAIELNSVRVHLARFNAQLYEVEDSIDFICGNAFDVLPSLMGKVDAVFLSPPWGGPSYASHNSFNLDQMRPYPASSVLKVALKVTPNVALLLPRNTHVEELRKLLRVCSEGQPLRCEVEQNFLGGRLKTLTLYFGDLIAD